ncbi:MAG: hypothetical protein QUV05_12215 [Phycisphaerae bacterium]|nr:hypothetical protein [Phycisphaerae bacterium]
MDQVSKEIVTVAEMARMCGLSRSRFYGLVKEGIMPQPSRNTTTKRPYYSREQQEQCLLVRRTNCGVNGAPILFYAHRLEMTSKPPTRKKPGKPSPKAAKSDPIVEDLLHGLEQLGMTEVPPEKVRKTLVEVYPDGYAALPKSTLLMTVFQTLRCPDSQNNVAR